MPDAVHRRFVASASEFELEAAHSGSGASRAENRKDVGSGRSTTWHESLNGARWMVQSTGGPSPILLTPLGGIKANVHLCTGGMDPIRDPLFNGSGSAEAPSSRSDRRERVGRGGVRSYK